MIAIIVQLLIGGILLGGLYALIAFGLSLIYGVARVLNFAHGTLLAIAGIAASVMFANWNLSPIVIAVILFPVFFGFGWLMYVALLEPLTHRNPMQMTVGTVLVTVGLLLVLSDLAALFAGHDGEVVEKITHRNAMAHFRFDPFQTRSREQCTARALRAETADVDTVTHVGRPADERDLESWRKLTTRPR